MAKVKENKSCELRDLRALLQQCAADFSTTTAYRLKWDGVWQDVSFARVAEDARALGVALSERFAPGARVLILGENGYHWALAFWALVSGAGVPVPVDAALPAKKIVEIARRAGATGVLYAASEVKKRRAFTGMTAICFDKFGSLVKFGKQRLADGHTEFIEREIDPAAPAAIFFTAGTTGDPKGVMLSHSAILATLCQTKKTTRLSARDSFLSVLPLSHAYECICGMLVPFSLGATVAFGEGLSHLLRNMREVRPTCMVTIPYLATALYEKCWQEIERRGTETVVRRAIAISDPVRPLAARQALRERLLQSERALFGGALNRLLILGGGLDTAVQKGLRQLGVFAVQGYGMTECAGLAALNADDRYRDGAAGVVFPDAMIDIYNPQPDGSGEIRYKGPNVMLGYVDDPERTAKVLRDGWYHTGDVGRVDEDGFLYVLGRVQNCIVTAGGRYICPEALERLLEQSPFIKEAAVVGVLNGDGNDCEPAALILPDLAHAEELYGVELSEDVLEGAIDEWIADINATLLPYQQIGLYALREEPFPRDDAGKVRREGLAEQLAAAIANEEE